MPAKGEDETREGWREREKENKRETKKKYPFIL